MGCSTGLLVKPPRRWLAGCDPLVDPVAGDLPCGGVDAVPGVDRRDRDHERRVGADRNDGPLLPRPGWDPGGVPDVTAARGDVRGERCRLVAAASRDDVVARVVEEVATRRHSSAHARPVLTVRALMSLRPSGAPL